MPLRKRNEFLEGQDSDEERLDGYDSEAVEESRGTILRQKNKRRKLDDQSDDSSHELDGELPEVEVHARAGAVLSRSGATSMVQEVKGRDQLHADDGLRPDTAVVRSSALKQAEKAQKAVRKSGVVYISRIPPFMKPHTLRHFLEPHASKGLGRIFLTPEEHTAYLKRVKNGGNKKRSFTDGWVEFASKTEAKIAAESLNGNIIGGKKGNFYHDDIWSMKYLKGFKWNHLTEQIANENAERAARLREEIRRTRQENKAYVEDIEKAKMLEGMESKKNANASSAHDGLPASTKAFVKRPGREFKQRKVQAKESDDTAADGSNKHLNRVLSRIF